jgi:hypothetical protein
MSLIDLTSVPQLAASYPRKPGRLRHHLTSEPLLSQAALTEARRALPQGYVERGGHDAGAGPVFGCGDDSVVDAQAAAATTADNGWLLLRHIEQLPRYRSLLRRLLAELAPIIGPATGPVSDVKGSVLITAPGAHTPFHFDAEYAILFQIAGDKVFAAYPPAPPFLDLARREAYHRIGDNMLDWRPDFAARGEQHLLSPGDALFVPYAAPHWVHSADSHSVSLSVTWQCRKSRAVADALTLNPLLRAFGLPAYDPAATPEAPWLRAVASRMGQKIGLV